MIVTVAAFLASLAGPGHAPRNADVVVCGRTTSFEDQYCDAVLIRRVAWTHAEAAAAHERVARYALPHRAAFSYLAAANNWVAKAVVAFDRALAAGLNEPDRRNVVAARNRIAPRP